MDLDDLLGAFLRGRRPNSPDLDNTYAILGHGLEKYADAISALRAYHQRRANFKYWMDIAPITETGGIEAVTNSMNQLRDGLTRLNKEIEKKAKGVLYYRNAALYAALMDGSGTVFDSHGKIKELLDSGIDVDFVAGFWFLFVLNRKAFECIHVDDGSSIRTFECLDEPARNGLVAAVHKMRMNEVNNLISVRLNPNTDYFAIIAEPDFHRYDIKMLLPYSALTTQ